MREGGIGCSAARLTILSALLLINSIFAVPAYASAPYTPDVNGIWPNVSAVIFAVAVAWLLYSVRIDKRHRTLSVHTLKISMISCIILSISMLAELVCNMIGPETLFSSMFFIGPIAAIAYFSLLPTVVIFSMSSLYLNRESGFHKNRILIAITAVSFVLLILGNSAFFLLVTVGKSALLVYAMIAALLLIMSVSEYKKIKGGVR